MDNTILKAVVRSMNATAALQVGVFPDLIIQRKGPGRKSLGEENWAL